MEEPGSDAESSQGFDCEGGLIASVGAAVTTTSGRCLKPGDIFKDCDNCPEMVVILAGEFMMGSPEDEEGRKSNEGPQHEMVIANAFAMGRFEVTRGEFAAFLQDSADDAPTCFTLFYVGGSLQPPKNRSNRNPGFDQEDSHPVTCASWNDAKAYVDWLSRKTGQTYRLPSEAEWEYAARAGAATRFHFGDSERDLCEYSNSADSGASIDPRNATCDDGVGEGTAAVGRYQPNLFGLYDMHGNVWEWVEDCYHENYIEVPDDGSAWRSGNCDHRLRRGGAWNLDPVGVRLARRVGSPVHDRTNVFGFRVARSLRP